MTLSRWHKDGESVEVVETPPLHHVAWNVTRGRFAVETHEGRVYFDSREGVERALVEDGWEPHCEHGLALDMHCCECRRRGFFPPDDCACHETEAR